MRVVLGLAVFSGFFLLFWFTFPVRSSEESLRVRRWFLVTALVALGACAAWLVLVGVQAAVGAVTGG